MPMGRSHGKDIEPSGWGLALGLLSGDLEDALGDGLFGGGVEADADACLALGVDPGLLGGDDGGGADLDGVGHDVRPRPSGPRTARV